MTDIKPITSITTNMWKFRTLVATIKLNLFEILENATKIDKIAQKIRAKPDSVERILNALTAMDFIKKEEDSYYNQDITKKFLLKSSTLYYGDFMLMNEEADDSWKRLDQVIINGPPTSHNRDRLMNQSFTRAMHNNAQAPARAISEMDFSQRKHLLDIGGGSGAFSIILTNKFSDLKATVIEQTTVENIIVNYIKKEGDPSKINTLPGDYFEIDYPKHDLALFGQIFHSNTIDENKKLLRKVYDSIENGGMVLITEFLLDETKSSPLFSTLFNLNMLKQCEGRAYTFSEIKSWLGEAGFSDINTRHLVGPHSLITAKK